MAAGPRPQPSYTFVEAGGAAPAESKRTKAKAKGDSVISTAPASSSLAASAPDSGLATGRRQAVQSASGEIPDLDIDLADNDIIRVMARYGYLPAVKTRTRLLGKISGQRFLPLPAEEMARYARRGRSGAQYPEAEKWRRRVAAELGLPVAEVQVIFLVPQETENLFVQAQRQALAAAGKGGREIALMRAHFDADLAVIVDELVTRAGEVVVMDTTPQQP